MLHPNYPRVVSLFPFKLLSLHYCEGPLTYAKCQEEWSVKLAKSISR